MGAKAAAPERTAVAQHQGGGGALRDFPGIRHGIGRCLGARVGSQVGQRQAGGCDHRGPVLRGNGAGLAPLAHRLGGDAGQAGSGIRTAHAINDVVHIGHAIVFMGKNFPPQSRPAGVGKYFPARKRFGPTPIGENASGGRLGRTSRRSPSRGSDGVDRELGGKAEPVQLARRGASGNPRQCPNPGSACRGPKKGERHGLAFITIHKISVSRWSPCSFRCRRQSGPAAGWRPIC